MTTERATTDPHPADQRPLLEIDRLSVDFRLESSVVHAVQDVSLHVHAGETLAVVGESGSGKSATALSVLRLNPSPPCVYTGGEIRFDGRDLLTLSEKELGRVRGRDIAMVFQDPMTCLDPLQRVGTQVAEVLRLHTGQSRAEARKAALAALDEVGIPDPEMRYRQYPHELSGGMLQRVLIAAAVAAEPRVLIADEATTALDVTVQAEILDLLADLRERTGLALVVVSHDLAVVAQLCDEVLVMRQGEVVEQGPTRTVLHAPRHAYTRLLISEHESYGLEKFRTPKEAAR